MDKEKDSGIMEVVAIAALLFLFWKFYIKKKEIPEPATTPAELKDQFARDPNFNLNDYCKDVIYRPLSSSDLSPSNLLGEGWCYRGDRSAIDESKGFGDDYAEKQADDYQTMKQDEAVFITNKSSIQFRLINSTASPITTNVLNSTTDSTSFNPGPTAPIANAGSSVSPNGFIANWASSVNAIGYFLDIATDVNFLSYLPGYQNKDVSNVLSLTITGLIESTNYYYRIRAYDSDGLISTDSNIILVTTIAVPLNKIMLVSSFNGSVTIRLAGTGTVDIDWGDGTIDTVTIGSPTNYTHIYTGNGGIITISNPAGIIIFSCMSANLTEAHIPQICIKISTVVLSDNDLTEIVLREQWVKMETLSLDFNNLTNIIVPVEWVDIILLQLDNNNLNTFLAHAEWVDLQQLQLQINNIISDTDINNILIALEASGMGPGNTVFLEGGTNAAPTGAGIVAKNNLIAAGVTVTTN